MPIALLKFPTDLLGEVFKLCDPFDLYKLSKCSKRTQKSIKLGSKKNWKIKFSLRNHVTIWADGRTHYFKKTENPEEYFEKIIEAPCSNMNIEFPNGGVVDLFIYLIETFEIRIVKSLEITFANIANVSKATNVLVERNMEIEEFLIGDTEQVQDVVNFMPMLNQMNVIQDFYCSSKFPPGFQFEFVKYPRDIHIRNSSWFTFDQLLDCTSERIELIKTTFNNHDLDVFLQKWKKTGAFPNLRYLRIHSIEIDNKSPIQGMIPPIRTFNNPRQKVSIPDNFYPDIVDAVRITKDDGTEGWLKVDVGSWPELNFLIADPADTVVEEITDNVDDDW